MKSGTKMKSIKSICVELHELKEKLDNGKIWFGVYISEMNELLEREVKDVGDRWQCAT